MADYNAIFPRDDPLSEESEGCPFRIPDLWRPSSLAPDLSQESPLFPIVPLKEANGKIQAPVLLFEIPDDNLFSFPTSTVPRASFSAWPSANKTASEYVESSNGEETEMGASVSSNTSEDVWMKPGTTEPPSKPRFQSWDSFLVPDANDPVNPYLTEAGPRIFDAVLEIYMKGLGRSSVLFTYDRKSGEFHPMREQLRISGCTTGSIDSIVKEFSGCGKNIKILQSFADDVYKNSTPLKPSAVALAECAIAVIESIQTRLSISPDSISSILHLHSLIREPALIVDTFVQTIEQTSGAMDDSQLLTRLFDVVQHLQHKSGWLKPLLLETLARVSRPWLEFVEEWIGLDQLAGGEGMGFERLAQRRVFVKVEEETKLDSRGAEKKERYFVFDKTMVPSFMSSESAETIFESGKSLRFLQKFHPNHPLSKPGSVKDVATPKLAWKFSWEDLDNLQNQAKNYEKNLQAAIERYTKNTSETDTLHKNGPEDLECLEPFGKSKEEISKALSCSLSAMNDPPPHLYSSHNGDSLRKLVLNISRIDKNAEHEEDQLTNFAPPISITPMLSFSHIFSVQSKLINTACLRMFFKEHKIRFHLSLLRRFQLFGDGVFSSRLSHALFDDELDSTQRQDGRHRTGGTMGLKLGSRDSWPPASSELRLALMGVLAESFNSSSTSHEHLGGIYSAGKENELPGGLSFAVRDMTQEELQKCMDPHGIEALDFLRLQYKPPSPLEAIITPTALYRYDRLFKLLLRVLRMLFVVNTLFRDATTRTSHWQGVDPLAQKFRIEAHHFVSTLCGYMFETGVGSSWTRFEEKLTEIERKMDGNDEDAAAAGGLEEGLERLRGYHESILDRIMFATLSRKRQAPVMKLVEDIFKTILSFAKYSRARALGKIRGGIEDDEVVEMYKGFRRKVGIFISVCRGLSEKRGYGDGRKDLEGRRAVDAIFGTGYREEGNLLGMLLVRLEMTGYYTDAVPGTKRKTMG